MPSPNPNALPTIQTPEAGEAALPPELTAFQGHVGPEIADFGVLHGYTGGVNTIGGTVSEASLSAALSGATAAAQQDPALLALMGAVNRDYDARQRAADAAAESGQRQQPTSVTHGPAFVILKQFGAVVPRPKRVAEAPEISSHAPRPHTERYMGQVIVDGHMLNGQPISGRNEVMTSAGIVKTRETPRLTNY